MTTPTTRLERLLTLQAELDDEISLERIRDQAERRLTRRIMAMRDSRRVASEHEKYDRAALEAAAACYQLTVGDILGDARANAIVEARHVAAWVLRKEGRSYPYIGKLLERDHTTIMAAVRRVERTPLLLERASTIRARLHPDNPGALTAVAG